MTSAPELDSAPSTEEALPSRIGQIAATLGGEHFPTGERAALKRFAPGQSVPLAYWRFWPRWLRAEAPPDTQSQDWALILAGLSLMGRAGHQPKARFGATLAEQGYSEQRLERLLAAEDAATRRQLFARTVRFLAAKGAAIDWLEAARFLLAGDALRESLAHRVARDYYTTQYHLESTKQN